MTSWTQTQVYLGNEQENKISKVLRVHKLHFSAFAAYRKHSKWRVMMQEKVCDCNSFPLLLRLGHPSLRGETSHFCTHLRPHACVHLWGMIIHLWLSGTCCSIYCLHEPMQSNSRAIKGNPEQKLKGRISACAFTLLFWRSTVKRGISITIIKY